MSHQRTKSLWLAVLAGAMLICAGQMRLLGADGVLDLTGVTNVVLPSVAATVDATNTEVATNIPAAAAVPAGATNAKAAKPPVADAAQDFNKALANARYLVSTHQYNLAEAAFKKLLDHDVPKEIQHAALFELGALVREENDLARAQAIYAQFINQWSDDVRVPEALLRQGQIFREMGLNNLALSKFYGVMTAALSLKQTQLKYYQELVLQAQIEIAETHYHMGKFAEAADFYARLLKTGEVVPDRVVVQFRLVRSLQSAKRYEVAMAEAKDFLSRYPNAAQEPEVRYYLAQAYKAMGQNGDALQQSLLLLQKQKALCGEHPEILTYWQQRVGNEVGNQLYQEGDYVRALEVYRNLVALDASPAWQLPLKYQIGLTSERLLQPAQALDTYKQIITHEAELGTNVTLELKTVFDMSRWRVSFLEWQNKAEADNHWFAHGSSTNALAGPNGAN